MAETMTETGRPWDFEILRVSEVFRVAASLAVSCGLFDVLVALVRERVVLGELSLLLLPAAATSLFTFLTITLSCGLLGGLLRGLGDGHQTSSRYMVMLATAIAGAVVVSILLGGFLQEARLTPEPGTLAVWLEPVVVQLATIVAAGPLVLLLLRWLDRSPRLTERRRHVLGVILQRLPLAVPLLLIAATVGVTILLAPGPLLGSLDTALQRLLVGAVFTAAAALLVRGSLLLPRSVPALLFVSGLLGAWFSIPPSTSHRQNESKQAGGGLHQEKESDSLVLITVDSFRADLLAVYGGNGLTPTLDRIVQEEGAWVKDSWSVAPWTLPSLASIHTGVSPIVHQTMDLRRTLPGSLTTLASALQSMGFATVALGSSVHLTKGVLESGFTRSQFYPRVVLRTALGSRLLRPRALPRKEINSVDPLPVPLRLSAANASHLSNQELVGRALAEIDQLEGQRFFLWLHFLDPHIPYSPSIEAMTDEVWTIGRVAPGFGDVVSHREGRLQFTGPERMHLKDLYDLEVRALDEAIDRLRQGFIRRNLWDDLSLVVTSDHGEEFFEHGSWEHGHSLYEELLRVPLVIKPGKTKSAGPRGEISVLANALNLPATVAELLEVELELEMEQELQPSVQALARAAEQGAVLGPVVASETYYGPRQVAIRNQRFKVIIDLEERQDGSDVFSRVRGFDLHHDPKETMVLGPDNRNVAALLEQLSRRRQQERDLAGSLGAGEQADGAPKSLSEREREQLEELGYVEP